MNPLTYFIGNQPKKVNWVWSAGPNLIQCCEKTKKNWYFNGFFYILLEVNIRKHEVVFICIFQIAKIGFNFSSNIFPGGKLGKSDKNMKISRHCK